MAASIVFFGTPTFASAGLAALLESTGITVRAVVTQPDRPAGRGHRLQPSPVKELAVSRGIPVLQPGRIRTHEPDFLAALASHGPFDLGVVIAFGQILPRATLDLPRLGCVNVHASLLPRWRGAAPIQRAIMAGDVVTGVCLMQMDEGLDTGPVFSRVEVPIGPADDAGVVHDALASASASLLRRDLPIIAAGGIIPTPQPVAGITYAGKIVEADQQLDWSRSAPELSRQIRGLSPAPGAWTTLAGERFKIYRAAPAPGTGGAPGELRVDGARLMVSCGSGAVELEVVQQPGRRRMSAAEFLRGTPCPTGTMLGHG